MGGLIAALKKVSPELVKELISYGDEVAKLRAEAEKARGQFISKEQFDAWRKEASPYGLSEVWEYEGNPADRASIFKMGGGRMLLFNRKLHINYGVFEPTIDIIIVFPVTKEEGQGTGVVTKDRNTINWIGTTGWKRVERAR
jgi:hypothetical protein